MLAILAVSVLRANAQVDQGKALAAIEAFRELVAAVNDAPEASGVPRIADPQHSESFAAALDESLAASGAERAAGLSLLFDLQREAGALTRAYLLKGIKAKSLSSDLSGEQAARNFVAFQPELAALYDLRVRIGAAIARSAVAMETGSRNSASISSALAAIADEQERVLRSVMAAASDQQVDAQWRGARVVSLNVAAADYTPLLGKKKSQELADRALAGAIAEADPTVAALLKDFALSLLR